MSRRAGTAVLVVALSLPAGGCAAGGLAAVGPLVSAFQIIGDRSVERTVPADLSSATAATLDAMSRMGLQLERSERGDTWWKARAEGGAVTVHAQLTHVTARMTKVEVRAESGGLTADKGTAEQIQTQIAQSLAGRATVAREAVSVTSAAAPEMATLEAEIRRLRSEMEASRDAAARPPAAPATNAERSQAPHVREGAVLSIPASYGVPTPVTTPAPQAPVLDRPRERTAAPPAVTGPDIASILAAPLAPVGVLTPVQPMAGLGGGN